MLNNLVFPLINNFSSHSINDSFYPILKDKNQNKQKGFSILEVLVTILVISGFLLGSLQATVLATFLRVQSQDKQETANWLQQDLELIKYQAFELGNVNEPTGLSVSKDNACTQSRYGERFQDFIDDSHDGSSNPSAIRVEIPSNSGKFYSVFRQYIATNNNLTINYIVAYAPGANSNAAHPRYKLNDAYELSTLPSLENTNIVTTLFTEVIPNAAFDCTPNL